MVRAVFQGIGIGTPRSPIHCPLVHYVSGRKLHGQDKGQDADRGA
jgi:hypothetical protein